MWRSASWISSVLFLLGCLLTVIAAAQDDGGQDDKGHPKGTRPRQFTAEAFNATTINLTWRPPRDDSGQCPVRRFVLRLKQDGAKRSRAWNLDGGRRALGLHNLKVSTTYWLRLVAITCKGKGRPTKWLEVRTNSGLQPTDRTDNVPTTVRSGIETESPGKPTYVRTRTFTDSVMVTWRQPDESEVLIRGYMVGYGEGVPDVNWQYVDSSKHNLTIKNLKPRTQYIVSLRAFNNFGKGPTVYDLIYTREETGPTVNPSSVSIPDGLRAKILSPTTVWLQWTDPSLGRHQQITDNRYYNVHYQSEPSGETLSVVVKAMHVVLYDLDPGVEYLFKVRTVRDAVYSEFSQQVKNKTFETAPGSPPRSVIVVPGNDSSAVRVSWRAPRQMNGKPTGYLVLYTATRQTPMDDWRALATADTETLVSGLVANKTYFFKVQARNSIGYGPLSKTAVFTTGDPVKVSSSDLTSGPDTDDGDLDGQDHDDDDDDDDDNDDYDEDYYLDSDEEEARLFEMMRARRNDTGFDINETLISSSNKNKRHDRYPNLHSGGSSALQGPARQPLTQAHTASKSPSGADHKRLAFKVQLHHTISAFITWPEWPNGGDCSADAHAQNVQYVLHYYKRGEEQQPTIRLLDTNIAVLPGLEVNRQYLYQIKYVFPNSTETAWSEEEVLDTQCSN